MDIQKREGRLTVGGVLARHHINLKLMTKDNLNLKSNTVSIIHT